VASACEVGAPGLVWHKEPDGRATTGSGLVLAEFHGRRLSVKAKSHHVASWIAAKPRVAGCFPPLTRFFAVLMVLLLFLALKVSHIGAGTRIGGGSEAIVIPSLGGCIGPNFPR
jgi:hypothetical protein